jgi:hypothetical protein
VIRGGTAVRLAYLGVILTLVVFLRLWPWHHAVQMCREADAAPPRRDSMVAGATQMPVPRVSRHLGDLKRSTRCDALLRTTR